MAKIGSSFIHSTRGEVVIVRCEGILKSGKQCKSGTGDAADVDGKFYCAIHAAPKVGG
jgi:hypothetical protein